MVEARVGRSSGNADDERCRCAGVNENVAAKKLVSRSFLSPGYTDARCDT